MIKSSLDFDAKKFEKELVKQALDAMKKKFRDDINKLAAPYGEKPKITFHPKGPKSVDVRVHVKSKELNSKIDEYLKKAGK